MPSRALQTQDTKQETAQQRDICKPLGSALFFFPGGRGGADSIIRARDHCVFATRLDSTVTHRLPAFPERRDTQKSLGARRGTAAGGVHYRGDGHYGGRRQYSRATAPLSLNERRQGPSWQPLPLSLGNAASLLLPLMVPPKKIKGRACRKSMSHTHGTSGLVQSLHRAERKGEDMRGERRNVR